MINYILCTLLIVSILLTNCNNKSNNYNNSNKEIVEINDQTPTATFIVDGKNYTGKVSTQYFGSNKETDNFSILCQQDEPLILLQATFANEKNATLPNLKPKGGSYKVNDGEYDLSLTMYDNELPYTINEKSGGILKIENKKLTINNIKLFDRNGKEKAVSASINYYDNH